MSDEYMDPLTFEPSSLIGVPNIMEAYRAGNVALINAPGNGVADDKGIYYFNGIHVKKSKEKIIWYFCAKKGC